MAVEIFDPSYPFPEEQLCATLKAYFALLALVGSCYAAVMITACLNFRRYIVFRSKGIWFITLLIVLPLTQVTLASYVVIVTCLTKWPRSSPQLLVVKLSVFLLLFLVVFGLF